MGSRRGRRAVYAAGDPRLAPAYTFAEAAHYLRLPVETLRYWALGYASYQPVFELDDPDRQHLSFWNLVEAHILSGIRRHHGVRLPMVRSALEYVQDRLQVSRPLILQRFQTDGRSLFVDKYDQLINASKGGQVVMGELLSARLRRVDFDELGFAVRLYPFTRPDEAQAPGAEQPRLVVVNPRVSFGRPTVRGVPTSAIWSRYRAGDSTAHLSEDYGLATEEVEEAVRCEAA
jgi:uncharacterized protein (DUF433 family)